MSTHPIPAGQLLMYQTGDGRSQIKLRAQSETVWLSQREMAELFDVSTDNVGLHLKNVFEDGELSREATTEESSVVQTQEASQADRQDDAELKALENTMMKRPKP